MADAAAQKIVDKAKNSIGKVKESEFGQKAQEIGEKAHAANNGKVGSKVYKIFWVIIDHVLPIIGAVHALFHITRVRLAKAAKEVEAKAFSPQYKFKLFALELGVAFVEFFRFKVKLWLAVVGQIIGFHKADYLDALQERGIPLPVDKKIIAVLICGISIKIFAKLIFKATDESYEKLLEREQRKIDKLKQATASKQS